MSKVFVHCADIVDWARAYEGKRFHAILCDPPYAISFMSKKFDTFKSSKHFQDTVQQWGEALLPLLYPGALVMMFGGTRMFHRLACGMEDAGFQMWDTMCWLYGQGFPKAQDLSKSLDKRLGAKRKVIGESKSGLHHKASVTGFAE